MESNYLIYLNECFTYKSGNLYWKTRPIHHFSCERIMNATNSVYAGKIAGKDKWVGNSKRRSVYRKVKIKGKDVSAHRVIWAILMGYIPNVIDHIDGNTLNNRISNLRDTDNFGNNRNRKVLSKNKLGIAGVRKVGKKYSAYIKLRGKFRTLGTFDNIFDAACARKSEEDKNGYLNYGANT